MTSISRAQDRCRPGTRRQGCRCGRWRSGVSPAGPGADVRRDRGGGEPCPPGTCRGRGRVRRRRRGAAGDALHQGGPDPSTARCRERPGPCRGRRTRCAAPVWPRRAVGRPSRVRRPDMGGDGDGEVYAGRGCGCGLRLDATRRRVELLIRSFGCSPG